ncbi:MAG: carbon-nitrogen hydrolase family protein [Saprospiraceae bacterium]|nr:carbon-nitrogen hydrolase family protein [Saprospiraceae bacterium]
MDSVLNQNLRVAVIQDTPPFFDLVAGCEQVAVLTEQASGQGANLVLFPESYLPGYPRGLNFGATVGNRTDAGRHLWEMYWNHSVGLNDSHYHALSNIAAENKVYLAIGITERVQENGSLYCSYLIFDRNGRQVHHHRKIKPTGSERLIWAEGDGRSIKTINTPWGKLGGLICWENMMPMARTALYEQGIQIYIAPTADARPSWIASMQHIAMEGRCYLLSANQLFVRDDYPTALKDYISPEGQCTSRGGSVIVSPLGEIMAGPLWDTTGILLTDLDMRAVVRSRFDFHPTGHYARPDIFTLAYKHD